MNPVHLLAEYAPQARLISALAQDAILSSADVALDREAGLAALAVSRFRWEAAGAPTRVRSLLVVRNVTEAARLRWPRRPAPIALLSVRAAEDCVRFDFADGMALRLRVERLRIALEDVGEPWRVRHAPRHDEVREGRA